MRKPSDVSLGLQDSAPQVRCEKTEFIPSLPCVLTAHNEKTE